LAYTNYISYGFVKLTTIIIKAKIITIKDADIVTLLMARLLKDY